MSRHWVKLYVEILDDHKLSLLSDQVFRTCINLIALAGRIDDEGRLGNDEEIAYALRLSHEQTRADLEELRKVRVTVLKNGVWHLKNFEKRNDKPPSASKEAVYERVKKYREKAAKREESNDVTPSLQISLQDESNEPRIDKNREEKNKSTAPKATRPPKPAKPDYYPLANALATICHMSIEANRGRLFREAELLSKSIPPATPELITQHYNGIPNSFWNTTDWRGKKGDRPTPATIRETWGQWNDVGPSNEATAILRAGGYTDANGKPV